MKLKVLFFMVFRGFISRFTFRIGSDVFGGGNAASTEASRQGNRDSKEEVSRSTFAAVFSKPKVWGFYYTMTFDICCVTF